MSNAETAAVAAADPQPVKREPWSPAKRHGAFSIAMAAVCYVTLAVADYVSQKTTGIPILENLKNGANNMQATAILFLLSAVAVVTKGGIRKSRLSRQLANSAEFHDRAAAGEKLENWRLAEQSLDSMILHRDISVLNEPVEQGGKGPLSIADKRAMQHREAANERYVQANQAYMALSRKIEEAKRRSSPLDRWLVSTTVTIGTMVDVDKQTGLAQKLMTLVP